MVLQFFQQQQNSMVRVQVVHGIVVFYRIVTNLPRVQTINLSHGMMMPIFQQ